MDVGDALARLGGVAAAADVVGLTSRRRVRTARAVNGYLSHRSAALHHGWEVWIQPDLPTVILPRGRTVPERLEEPADLVVRDLPGRDRDGWATSHLRTVLDCARELRFADALAVADSALRHGDLAVAQLASVAERLKDPQARAVLLQADARAANPFESALRALAVRAGLDVVPQYEIRCGDLVLHPDLADPVRGVAVEADSWGWHAAKWDHDRDCARYNAMVVAGWLVLRFTWEQVRHAPDRVVETIRAVAATSAG